MKVLLHSCCGPCTVGTLKEIDRILYDVDILWYNPNIHPYIEYKARRNNLLDYAKKENIKVINESEYGLREFVEMVSDDLNHRCHKCYKDRLSYTAKIAKERGYDYFTTTLLVSPYQKHEYIKKISEELAIEYDIKFLYVDPREHFRAGNQEARDEGQYMQKYCGCVFSEEERYLKKYWKKK